jgi:hypothetical protein
MRTAGAAAVAAVTCLTACSFGGDEQSAAERADYVTDLIRLGREDERHGVVGLESVGRKTRVLVEVFEPQHPRLEAEIQSGNCDVLGSAVYPLNSVEDGVSETVVNVSLSHLRRAGYLVMVGDPGPRLGGLCGDLYRAQPPDAAPTFD